MDEEWDDNYEPEGEYDPERDGQVEPDPPEEPDDWSDAEESSDVIPAGNPIDAYSTGETRETWWRLASGGTPPTAPSTTNATTTPTGWTMTRPTVTSDATAAMHAYECERTVYGDSSCSWGAVSMSVNYENEAKAWLAAKAANEANAVAGATAQHFWHDTDGVHVTDEEQDDWVTEYAKTGHGELGNPTSAKPWHNQLINSLGTLIRTGLRNLVSITRSAIAFYDGQGNATQNVTARFGTDGAQIGKTSDSRIELDYHSMKLIDRDGNTYLHVSDLRDAEGLATISEEFVVDDSTRKTSDSTIFTLSYTLRSAISVTLDDNELSSDEYSLTYNFYPLYKYLHIPSVLNNGQKVTIEYLTAEAVRAFTFGQRSSGSFVGPESFAEGHNVIASSEVSHAEGYVTQATGYHSHAEGDGSRATGSISHAEGNGSRAIGNVAHAEGTQTRATGHASHAEGSNTEASGSYSHAQNYETIATGNAQTAIGRYNVEDTDERFAFIVGNGGANNRSNAFTVDWNGDICPSKRTVLKSLANRDNPSGTAIYDNEHSVYITDADGERVGIVRVEQPAGGNISLSLLSIGEKTDGTEVINQFALSSHRDGTKTYYVADPAAFRSAIGLARVTQAITASNGVASGSVRLIANATMATINVNGLKLSSTLSSNSSIVIGNVPSAYRPYVSTFALVAPTSTAVGRLPLKIWVSATDGTVNLQNFTGSTVGTAQTIEATLTYVI